MFPVGSILAGIVSLILEKSTDVFHVYVAQSFGRMVYDMDYYDILFYSSKDAKRIMFTICSSFCIIIIFSNGTLSKKLGI
ncbi:hypothetical protein I4U23_021750 [Adineta vaga]|nr:hypothetical protein I4U23_021750 [Adineta vaga]